jgi:ubiquinone/menaquinone biosynthesis C-methylase UbiE
VTFPASSPFDELAADYDRFRIGYAPELYEALEAHGIGAGTHVLDVAAGTGLATRELVARGAHVTGIDISQPMLELARQHVANATFVLGRAEELPFADAAFDAAVSAQSFHWFDRSRALAELVRVVRPGGTIAIWWKELMRGDTLRLVREEVSHEVGVPLMPPITSEGFDAFEESVLVDRSLHVIPWIVPTTVAQVVGYERSRARPSALHRERLDAYLDALARHLGGYAGDGLRLSYVHLLYLGRVPDPSTGTP